MAQKTVKIAISLPKDAFRSLEKLRKQLGLARSALIAQALQNWINEHEQTENIRRYLEGYRRYPETAQENDAAAATAHTTLSSLEWED